MIVRLSENTLLISLPPDKQGDTILRMIKNIVANIHDRLGAWVIDIIPSYVTIHITFDVCNMSAVALTKQIQAIVEQQRIEPLDSDDDNGDSIQIPVYYGPEVGLDLVSLAQQKGRTPEEIVALHTATVYSVYAVDFAVGFAYLGYVDEQIATPRKATPRHKVVAGSVGIADSQTAIYPDDSPGGWQIIGKTPLRIVDISSGTLSWCSTGDRVQFYAIDKAQFLHMGGVL